MKTKTELLSEAKSILTKAETPDEIIGWFMDSMGDLSVPALSNIVDRMKKDTRLARTGGM